MSKQTQAPETDREDNEEVGETVHPFTGLGTDEEETLVDAAPAASTTPIFKGINKSFVSMDELTSYVTELERKQIEAEARLSMLDKFAVKPPSEPSADEPTALVTEEELNSKYAERMFSEPAKVLKELAEDIEARIERKGKKSQDEKQFWSSFYDEFADLNGLDDIVQLQLHRKREEWSKLPVDTARKLLAHEARSAVARIRGMATPTETLPSGSAVTAGATRGSTPVVGGDSKVPARFVDQVKRLNKRHPAQAG